MSPRLQGWVPVGAGLSCYAVASSGTLSRVRSDLRPGARPGVSADTGPAFRMDQAEPSRSRQRLHFHGRARGPAERIAVSRCVVALPDG